MMGFVKVARLVVWLADPKVVLMAVYWVVSMAEKRAAWWVMLKAALRAVSTAALLVGCLVACLADYSVAVWVGKWVASWAGTLAVPMVVDLG